MQVQKISCPTCSPPGRSRNALSYHQPDLNAQAVEMSWREDNRCVRTGSKRRGSRAARWLRTAAARELGASSANFEIIPENGFAHDSHLRFPRTIPTYNSIVRFPRTIPTHIFRKDCYPNFVHHIANMQCDKKLFVNVSNVGTPSFGSGTQNPITGRESGASAIAKKRPPFQGGHSSER